MGEEYGSWGLRNKITAIICEEWPKTPDNGLERATIYERLRGDGVAFSDRALHDVLLQLAEGGAITLVLGGGVDLTIREVSPELCQ